MVMVVLLLASVVTSCDSISKKNKQWSVEKTHQFPNSNWAFEEEVLDFDFDIEDTTQYYEVSVALVYDTNVTTLKDIPLSLTLKTPDGMQSVSKSRFLLDKANNPDIKMQQGNIAELEVVVFPRRKFKAPGTHTLTVYRRAEKADNYGFISLSTKVKTVK
jgi:hypothetical protein